MYLKVFTLTFAAWISFSFAQLTTQKPVESDHDLGPCDKENYDRRKLVKDSDGNETRFICSWDNDVYAWKKGNMGTEIDDADDVMEDIMLKPEAAMEFFQQRDRRGIESLNHECFSECCNWEEVREYYYKNEERHQQPMERANKYWNSKCGRIRMAVHLAAGHGKSTNERRLKENWHYDLED